MRQRINTNIICSSFNYESSHKAHINMLKRNHEDNISSLNNFNNKNIKIEPHYTQYKIWGQWKPIIGSIERYKDFELR